MSQKLRNFASVVRTLADKELDLTDLYIIAEYHRLQAEKETTVMLLAKSTKLSRTVVHRRLKELVRKGVLAKTERGSDLRVKPLIDGEYMGEIVNIFDNV